MVPGIDGRGPRLGSSGHVHHSGDHEAPVCLPWTPLCCLPSAPLLQVSTGNDRAPNYAVTAGSSSYSAACFNVDPATLESICWPRLMRFCNLRLICAPVCNINSVSLGEFPRMAFMHALHHQCITCSSSSVLMGSSRIR